MGIQTLRLSRLCLQYRHGHHGLVREKTWGDVGISIAKAAAAGGIVAAVTYAWSIWGS
ncbi:hypothetical protein JCM19052_2228 [Vibrio sp. JCM 19052]|nr:hypothetical protein JCM19052_2228 [Vibrio sp. JCM 19052]